MQKSLNEKLGTYGRGEGAGRDRRARYVTPYLSYTTGWEGESRARKIYGMGKLTDTIREQLFRQSTPTSHYSNTVGVFRFKITLDKPKQALIALICCGKYIAVSMPVHGDLIDIMSRFAISWTALGTNWVYSSRDRVLCGRMAKLCLT